MKKILIFTASEGHLSIAQTLQQILESRGFTVKLVDFFTEKGMKYYVPFYRYTPFLVQLPYKIMGLESLQKGFNLLAERLLLKQIKQEIKLFQPDLIITTNFAYNPALGKMLDFQKTSIPFINLITNPWTIHPIEFSNQANINLVYDQVGVSLGKKNKLNDNKLCPIGWLVREQFYQTYSINRLRKKMGFKKNIFTLLVCGGSEGTNFILKIIPGLLTIKKSLQVIIVCGTNKTLFKAMDSFKKIVQKINQSKTNPLRKIAQRLNLKIFSFTDQLPQLMSISDLVIGKAGPNLIFETTTCKKPFFAICHISGQEDENLALIRKKKLGWVEENPFKAIILLHKIINQPIILKSFQKSILKERFYNKTAGDRLIKTVNQLIYGKGSTKKIEF